MHNIIHPGRNALLLVTAFMLSWQCAISQVSSSFELRYYDPEKEANGQTDFKGGTALFTTEQRVEFLGVYASVASAWFMDSALDTRVNTPEEIDRLLAGIKPRPLPVARKRILLKDWKTKGSKPGDPAVSRNDTAYWNSIPGVIVNDGALRFRDVTVHFDQRTDTLNWRFQLHWKVRSTRHNVTFSMGLLQGKRVVAEAGLHSNGNIFFTDNGTDRMGMAYEPGRWYDMKMEVDLVNDRYNLYVDGEKIGDWVRLRP